MSADSSWCLHSGDISNVDSASSDDKISGDSKAFAAFSCLSSVSTIEECISVEDVEGDSC